MTSNKFSHGAVLGLCCAAMLTIAPAALATPYASGIVSNGASSTFVLNEDADNVTIVYDGATTVDLGAQSKGTVGFDATLGATYEIVVLGDSPAGWTQISDDTLTQSKYYSPRGVAVDTNPMRSTFGAIVVGEAYGGSVGAGGRTTTDGIYIMSADQADVTGQGDAAYGGGVDWSTSSSSPLKVSMNQADPTGADYSIYISDWSDSHSGVWTADALSPSTAFNELLDNTGRDGAGVVLENGGAGPGQLHGSVSVGPWVEGAGVDRVMYTVDEDVARGNVWKYDIGATTSGYSTAPTAVVEDANGYILNGLTDVVRDEDGTWWVAQYRYTDSDEVPSLSHWEDGNSTPLWTSGESTVQLDQAYGSVDIHNGLDLLALGTNKGAIYIMDISDPSNPQLLDTVTHSGSYVRDVAFDAAGNLYAVSSSSETLRIYSPGGSWSATTGSDGAFSMVAVIPEPSAVALLCLSGVTLLCGRRRLA